AIIMGLATVVMTVVLTYMGTPGYGIETPPAQNILSHLVPATHPGPVKELPWDEIGAGPLNEARGVAGKRTYFVSYPESWPSDPAYADSDLYVFVLAEGVEMNEETHGLAEDSVFLHLLREYKAEVENEPLLMAPVDDVAALAQVTVEETAPGLKWVEFKITWDEMLTDRDGNPVSNDEGQILLKRESKEVPEPDVQVESVAVQRESNYASH
ncbi:MAG: hypothetical protein JRH11_24720, partial [Deltaproteobacteria bacterium]|nr:hypothetical protein [Deltaproteobacteria bacterium]